MSTACPNCGVLGYKHPDDHTGTYYLCDNPECRVREYRSEAHDE